MRPSAIAARLRIRLGLVPLVAAVFVPAAALLSPFVGPPTASSNLAVGRLVAGVPETLCLVAAALAVRAPTGSLSGLAVVGSSRWWCRRRAPMAVSTPQRRLRVSLPIADERLTLYTAPLLSPDRSEPAFGAGSPAVFVTATPAPSTPRAVTGPALLWRSRDFGEEARPRVPKRSKAFLVRLQTIG